MVSGKEEGTELTVSKQFPKHLMEKSGLLRYAAESGRTYVSIFYDADTGDGHMYVTKQNDK